MSASASLSPQREALAAETLRRSGRLRLQVRGESMLPAVWPGDVVEITACSLIDMRRGEIVLAHREGRFFLHRFIGSKPDGFSTRGDSMPAPDLDFPSDALLGKLTQVVRAGRTMPAPVPTPLNIWTRAVGIFFCYCRPVRSAALRFQSWRNSRHLQLSEAENA